MKTCTRCKLTKPLKEFHRQGHRANGFNPQCKLCRRETRMLRLLPEADTSKAKIVKALKHLKPEQLTLLVDLINQCRASNLRQDKATGINQMNGFIAQMSTKKQRAIIARENRHLKHQYHYTYIESTYTPAMAA